jgi:hypothetical protein
MKRGFQPRTAGLPSPLDDAAFSEACRLDPPQHVAGAAPVVADEPGVPEKGECERHDYVDENETPHGRLWGEIVLLIDATAQGEEEEKNKRVRSAGKGFATRAAAAAHSSAKARQFLKKRAERDSPNCAPLIDSASLIQRQGDPLAEQHAA